MNSTTDRQATNRGVEITPVGNQLAQAPRLEHVAGEDMRAHLSSAAPQADLGQVYMAGDRLHHIQRVEKWGSGQTWSGLLGQDYVKVGQRLNEGNTRLLDWDSLLDQNSNARCMCPIAELSRLGRSLELVVLPSIQSAPIQSRSIPFSTIQSRSVLFNPSHRYYFCNSARGTKLLTSAPFSTTHTESSLPVSAASCLMRMLAARPAGPAPTMTTS